MGSVTNCKVISSENLTAQNLLAMDYSIMPNTKVAETCKPKKLKLHSFLLYKVQHPMDFSQSLRIDRLYKENRKELRFITIFVKLNFK